MVAMGIDNFEHYSQKLNKILDSLNSFCAGINCESSTFCHPNPEIDEIIEKTKKIKTHKDDDGKANKEKTIVFLYKHSMDFIPTDKVKGDLLISGKFLSNMIAIVKNQTVIHHSHVTVKSSVMHTTFAIKNVKKILWILELKMDGRIMFLK